MSRRRPAAPPPETRAEVARRRLAQLAATFEETTGGPAPRHAAPRPVGAPSAGTAGGDALDEHLADTDLTAPDLADAPDGTHGVRPAVGERWRESVARVPRVGTVHVRVLATVAAAAGVLLTWWLLAERPRTDAVDEPVDVVTATAEPDPGAEAAPGAAAPSGEVVVDVAGRVRRPGIVVLPAGSRVHEAIERAGGAVGDVDTTSLNLARVLTDGEQVLVGVEGAPAPAPGAAGGAPAGPAGVPVNLNTATLEQLDSLPGVGPVTAQAILDWRTENGRFASVDDLLQVSGIGEKTLAELRDQVTV